MNRDLLLKLSFIILAVTLAVSPLITSDVGSLQAEADTFTPVPLEDLTQAAATLLAALVGIPAFIAGALAILEKLKLLTEEQSDTAQIYANSTLYLLAFLAVFFGFTDVLHTIDHYLGGIAPILVALLALLSGAIHSIAQTARVSERIRLLQ